MPGMQSAAMTLLIDAGVEHDPADRIGTSTVLAEWLLRGAGDRDSRELTNHLDRLGLQRSSSVGIHHARFSSAALASNVLQGLSAYADIVLRARLPADGFEPACDLAMQALEGIGDDPRHALSVKLRQCHFPDPLGRNTMGELEHLKSLTPEDCRRQHAACFKPAGAIIAFAGNIEATHVRNEVQHYLGNWKGHGPGLAIADVPKQRTHHQHQDSEQTHIGFAYSTIAESHADYYAMRLAIEALGGGMSGRLFTEIREKRALVYNVSAGYSSLKGVGSIMGYAGTSNDRAQATLECLLLEVRRLSQGISADELHRAKVVLKAGTIMSGESTSARSGSIAHDFFMRGRIRTMPEILNEIERVTLAHANRFLADHPPGDMTIVTVGPKPLNSEG